MTNPLYTSAALEAAEDANYSTESDPYDGTPVKVAPLTALLRQGVRPEQQTPAQYRNWVDNQFALILGALIGDLSSEQSQILSGSSGSFVVPATVNLLRCFGCGGGGGGAGGFPDLSGTASRWLCGGGGGGAALASMQLIPVTPGETLTYIIGALGTGGASGTDGGDGHDTLLKRAGTTIAAWTGAGGGRTTATVPATSSNYAVGMGGGPTLSNAGTFQRPGIVTDAFEFISDTPSAGGCGTTSNVGNERPGNYSPQGFPGGASGVAGTDASTHPGGGLGGGGGGSAFGPGGAGGNGGNGNDGGVGAPGTGGAGAGGLGAGGGGGGGAGAGSTGGAAPGTGGGGGEGTLTLYWTVYGPQ